MTSPPLLQGPCPGPRSPRRGLLAGLALALAVALLCALALRATPGSATSTRVIDSTREQIRALEAEPLLIDSEASAAAAARAEGLRRVEELRARVAETTEALREARVAHGIAVQRLERRLVAIYTQEPPSLIEIVLSSGGLAQAVDAGRALEAMGDADRRVIERLEESRARLSALRADLEGARAAAERTAAAAGARMAELEGLLRSRRAVLDQARSTLDDLIAQEERRREAEAARRARAAAIAAAGERAEESILRQADPAAPPPPAAAAASDAPAPDALERIAQCESGGDPRAVSASGQYRGKYQFDPATWRALGGTGDPAAAPEAEQDRLAALLYAQRGAAPWPVCGYR